MSSGHRIEVQIHPPGDITAEIICDMPEGSSCRLWCDEDCGNANRDHWETHTLRDQGYCAQSAGPVDVEVLELYVGDSADLRSGPVKLEWSSDSYTWKYDDD